MPTATQQVHHLVEAYFERYGVPRRRARILVAVSGGPDSMALLTVLRDLSEGCRWQVGVAHVNHGLRGRESDADEQFVADMAARWNLPMHGLRLRIENRRQGENLQAWARRERYRFFEKLAGTCAYDRIAVAHQLNDRAETVAAAILQGGGTFALSGIPPVRGRIIRPLFDVSRKLILEFLEEGGVSYREDPSNDKTCYERNHIRRDILPVWEKENPNIVAGLARLGEQLWRQRAYLEKQAESVLKRALLSGPRSDLRLDAGKLWRYNEALGPFVLRQLIDRVGLDMVPTPATVERFSRLRRTTTASRATTVEQGELRITRSKDIIRIRAVPLDPIPSPASLVAITIGGVPDASSRRGDDRTMAQLDQDSIKGTVRVRYPNPGDRYQPLGLKGSKKLSDLLADRHVPSFDRDYVPVLVDDQGILWPVGHPIAHRARLTNRTQRVLVARAREGSWKTKS